MFTDIPMEQERHSRVLPNILTAAHSLKREGRRYKERENILLSDAVSDFFFTLDFRCCLPRIRIQIPQNSYTSIFLFLLRGFRCGDAVREYLESDS